MNPLSLPLFSAALLVVAALALSLMFVHAPRLALRPARAAQRRPPPPSRR